MLGKVLFAVFALGSTISVQLGPEFWLAVNTALNLATFLYVQKQHAKVKSIEPKIEHVERVADVLDTRVEGGRRDTDPAVGVCP